MSKLKTFDKHLEEKYGKKGTKQRNEFESKSKDFMVGELLKETRKSMHLTQEELADKTGTIKKLYFKIREW